MSVIRNLGTVLIYAATSALVVGASAMAVWLLSPVVGFIEPAAQGALSPSPRIAAWQERMAEEKIYAERYAVREAEEKARWAALGKLPMTPQVTTRETTAPIVEDPQDGPRAARAQREMMQRAQQQDMGRNELFPDARSPIRRLDNAFSTSRDESRGN